jgi:serine/threonine-protein kinase
MAAVADLKDAASVLYSGRYSLIDLVGAGGAGTVYRARDLELDEIVALKVLRKELVRAPAVIERFRSEVKLARRVTHRNIARMFDMHHRYANPIAISRTCANPCRLHSRDSTFARRAPTPGCGITSGSRA